MQRPGSRHSTLKHKNRERFTDWKYNHVKQSGLHYCDETTKSNCLDSSLPHPPSGLRNRTGRGVSFGRFYDYLARHSSRWGIVGLWAIGSTTFWVGPLTMIWSFQKFEGGKIKIPSTSRNWACKKMYILRVWRSDNLERKPLRCAIDALVSSWRMKWLSRWTIERAVWVTASCKDQACPNLLMIEALWIYVKHCETIWLVVSTPLKNISQLGWLFPIYGKIKNVPNHQPAIICSSSVR